MTAMPEAAEAPPPIKAVPVRHPGRWLGGLVVAVLVAMLVHSLVANPQYHWSFISSYVFTGPVVHAVLRTLLLTVIAMAVGIVGGVMLAVMRLSPNPIVSGASWLYIWFFRGTPVLVQLLLWYNLSYLFPHISLGVPFGPHLVTFTTNSLITQFTAVILGLGLNEAAYMAEIVRAGILSVDEGQNEAASALGMSRTLVMRRIVLPQAMRVIVPPTGNETISMLKTTSLASVIAYPELLQAAQNIANRTYVTIPALLVACGWYLVATSVLTVGQYYVERHYGRGASRQGPARTLPQQLWLSVRHIRPRGVAAASGSGRPGDAR